jgi:hypothetical protein
MFFFPKKKPEKRQALYNGKLNPPPAGGLS